MSSTLQPIEKHRMGSNNTINTMASSSKRNNEKQLVNFSVRAQDFILKKGMHNYSKSIDMGGDGNSSLPLGLGNFAPGSNNEMSNYLDDTTNLPNKDMYATEPENEDNDAKPVGQFELPKIVTKN